MKQICQSWGMSIPSNKLLSINTNGGRNKEIKKYILSILIIFLSTTAVNAQRLTIYTDLVGNFLIKIRIHESSITVDRMGNIQKINRRYDPNYEGSDLRLESSHQNTKKGRIKRLDGCEIEYDFFTDNISKIGDLLISYDFSTKRISKIGNKEFKYDFFSDRIEKIGNAVIKYDFFSEKMSQIGDVNLKYDTFSKQLIYIGNNDFEYEFDENNDVHNRNDENDNQRPQRDFIKFSYDDIDFSIKI